jgi:hypothetical protein
LFRGAGLSGVHLWDWVRFGNSRKSFRGRAPRNLWRPTSILNHRLLIIVLQCLGNADIGPVVALRRNGSEVPADVAPDRRKKGITLRESSGRIFSRLLVI